MKNSLKDAFIIPTPVNNYHASPEKLLRLETHLQQGDLLGIGWGETISKMLETFI